MYEGLIRDDSLENWATDGGFVPDSKPARAAHPIEASGSPATALPSHSLSPDRLRLVPVDPIIDRYDPNNPPETLHD